MGKPNFIIIGSMKCGTGTLFHNICQHTEVTKGSYKETHFFDRKKPRNGYGFDWYEAQFPDNSFTGEATPSYTLLSENQIQEIIEHYPNVKFIAIYRNPIARAISHYWHVYKKRGLKFLKKRNNQVINRSLYAKHLKKWDKIVGIDNMLLLKSEDLFNLTALSLIRVNEFLGIDLNPPENLIYKGKGDYSQPTEHERKTIYGLFNDFRSEIEADTKEFQEMTGIKWDEFL